MGRSANNIRADLAILEGLSTLASLSIEVVVSELAASSFMFSSTRAFSVTIFPASQPSYPQLPCSYAPSRAPWSLHPPCPGPSCPHRLCPPQSGPFLNTFSIRLHPYTRRKVDEINSCQLYPSVDNCAK